MQQPDLATILGQALRRSDWNTRLAQWSKPASETEGEQIERAARMVRAAIAGSDWLAEQGVEVIPQGSYRNNTNVRTRADMDLCVRHPIVKPIYGVGVTQADILRDLNYAHGPAIPDVIARMKTELSSILRAKFGQNNISPGSKAFTISAVQGSRSDIDVVPAVRAQIIVRGNTILVPYRVTEGIMILAPGGVEIYNYPAIHHANGKAKRERTAHRFKKIVRQMKSMRDDLVDAGKLKPSQVPSFLIECLVYLVEDEHFRVDEDHYDRFRRILSRQWELLRDRAPGTLFEINDLKQLFGPHQPWTIEDARDFLRAAYERTNN